MLLQGDIVLGLFSIQNKIMKYFLFFLITVASSQLSIAQNNNFATIDKSPLDMVTYKNDAGELIARVIYSRPSKRYRGIFGYLVPYNEVWRTGANEATEITFYKTVKIGENTISPGSFSVFTIPGKEEWTFILNYETNIWGSNYDSKRDAFREPMSVLPSETVIENFSINFAPQDEGTLLFMGWDKTIAYIGFTVVD